MTIRVNHTLIFKDTLKAYFQDLWHTPTTAQPPWIQVGYFPPATSVSLVEVAGRDQVDTAEKSV